MTTTTKQQWMNEVADDLDKAWETFFTVCAACSEADENYTEAKDNLERLITTHNRLLC